MSDANTEPFQIETGGELDADATLSFYLKAPGVKIKLRIEDDAYGRADQVLAAVPTAMKAVLERLAEVSSE